MALQEYFHGSVGPLLYDDTDEYPDAVTLRGFRAVQMYLDTAPAVAQEVVRQIDLTTALLEYLRRDGTTQLTGDWNAGDYKITAAEFHALKSGASAQITVESDSDDATLNVKSSDGAGDTGNILFYRGVNLRGTIQAADTNEFRVKAEFGNLKLIPGAASYVDIGEGGAGIDYGLRFDGESNDGIITWKEDEAQFEFNNEVVENGRPLLRYAFMMGEF